LIQPEPEEDTSEQLSRIEELEKQIEIIESQPEPIPEPPSSSRGSLPKDSQEELPQELDLAPEPEEDTSEQLNQLNDLQKQIDDLENELFSKLNPSSDDATPKQISKIKKLEKEIEEFESVDIEHEIIQTLQKQNKKLDEIEKNLDVSKKTTKKTAAKKTTKKTAAKKTTKKTAAKKTTKKTAAKKTTKKNSS
jgi:hypothetical protein